MRTLCFFLVLFIGGLMIQDFAYSQTRVVIVEQCPDDEFIQSIGLVTTLVTTWVTVAGETTTSDTLRGLSFIIGGVFVLAVGEPEYTGCITLIEGLALSSIMGGGFGLILSWLNHALTLSSPNAIPTWQIRDYNPYAMPRWDLGVYRRGLRFTYRF